MCGFAGMINDNNPAALEKMSLAIRHRGPDDSKLFQTEGYMVAFRRLSIIDLEKGSQPFSEGDIVGVFNGEIYNYLQLQAELKEQGESFVTNSEIEVLCKLYKKEGIDFVKRLRGMFAFAIYDQAQKKLALGRDRFGIKPLYYLDHGDSLLFSGEMKAFLFDEGFSGFKVSEELLQHYFTFQYVPEPQTMGGATALEAGTVALYDAKTKKLEIKRYFDPMFKPDKTLSFEDKAKRLREVLTESVKAHMISDVPVGTFLSSGIDSAIITSIASKLSPGIKAFTVAFAEKDYSEIDDAAAIAKHLDVEHIKLIADAEDFKNAFEKVVWHLDSPVADPSTVAIYLICQEAARHLKVILSGEGSDELFGGYRVYDEQRHSGKIGALPGFMKSFLAWLANLLPEGTKGKNLILRGTTPLEQRYVGNAFVFPEKAKPAVLKTYSKDVHFSSLTAPYYQRANEAGLSSMLKMQYLDMNTWIRGDILVKGDRLAMAHSLEARVPFLDREVFDFASTLCDDDKLKKGTTKYILRYAFSDMVDEATFMRPKKGYPVPVRKWLKNELYSWAKEIIESSTADDYINKQGALKLLEDHKNNVSDNYRKLWVILVFITWYRLYVTDAEKSRARVLKGEL
ncbi:MAG: asparagine synthase (glutamine-hydrolyzing) [Ruminococcaceae bacterium]|nr:asparagine synthase (glutamine-hydrolyzing) [Oscillospiraceae bacterium]